MLIVNKTKMQEGLEEALKHQLNLIEESIERNLVTLQEERIKDYQVIKRKAIVVGVNTGLCDEVFYGLVAKLKTEAPYG